MLNCWRAKRKFSRVIDGAASPGGEKFVMDHLQKCARCAKLFGQLKKVEDLARKGLGGVPYVDWEKFEKETVAKTMDKLARRGRLKKRDKTG